MSGWMRERELLDNHYMLMKWYDLMVAEDKRACLSSEQTFRALVICFLNRSLSGSSSETLSSVECFILLILPCFYLDSLIGN